MILKALLLITALCVPPVIGTLFLDRKKAVTLSLLAEACVTGNLAVWGLFQLLSVPMIQLRAPFSALYWTFLAAAAALLAFSIAGLRKRKVSIRVSFPDSPVMRIALALAVGLILFQAGTYLLGMHKDQDDARWLAEANDALSRGTMFLHNPATGEYLGRFTGEMVKDVYAPWPMFMAALSRFTGIRAVTLAHTFYAPVLLLVSYLVFYLTGRRIFAGRDERIIFLLAVSVITLFFYGGSDSEAAFALSRIWQGKAAVAAVGIPALFCHFLTIRQENNAGTWCLLPLYSCACCLFSGMGAVSSLIMIGGYGLYLIVCGQWKRIPLWILSMVPALVFELGYLSIS